MLTTLMRKMMILFVIILASAPIGAQDVPAGNDSDDVDYSVFSLEELFRVNVITASKQQEPLWDAPGVVTVLTSQEIAQFGGNNLWELLDRFPGLQENFSSGVNTVSIRGGEGFSPNHVLMLIDGRPLRTSNGNTSLYNAYASFPITMIDRIEVVRGPGSVLYGTNAFEGVINIITKKSKKSHLEFNTKTGSYSTKSGEVYFRWSKGDLSVDAGAYYFDTEGWPYTSTTIDGASTFTKDVFGDNQGYHTSLNYKGFSLSAYYGSTKQFTEISFANDGFSFHSKVLLLNLGYSHEFNDVWRLELHATRNEEDFDWLLDGIDGKAQAPRSEDDLFEATLFARLSDEWNFLLGGVYQKWVGYNLQAAFANAIDYPIDYLHSAYGQFTYRPNRFLKMIGGAQLNKSNKTKEDVVPRVGAILNFSPRLGMKLLYGQAFRSPNGQDRGIDIPGFQLGFEGLESEKIKTYNVQAFYQGDRQQFILTAFDTVEEQLIRLLPPTREDWELFEPVVGDRITLDQFLLYNFVSKNSGELKVKGVELETKFAPRDNWYVLGAFSYQENENEVGTKDVTLAPSFLLKAGVAYSGPSYFVSLFNAHYDEYKDNRIVNPSSLQLNPPSQPFDILSLNARYNWKLERMDLSFDVYGYNLLDEEVWTHELPFDVVNTIPGREGRSIYGTLRARF